MEPYENFGTPCRCETPLDIDKITMIFGGGLTRTQFADAPAHNIQYMQDEIDRLNAQNKILRDACRSVINHFDIIEELCKAEEELYSQVLKALDEAIK